MTEDSRAIRVSGRTAEAAEHRTAKGRYSGRTVALFGWLMFAAGFIFASVMDWAETPRAYPEVSAPEAAESLESPE